MLISVCACVRWFQSRYVNYGLKWEQTKARNEKAALFVQQHDLRYEYEHFVDGLNSIYGLNKYTGVHTSPDD
eukprot:7234432-Ditylum_brightwellii.AAC.1